MDTHRDHFRWRFMGSFFDTRVQLLIVASSCIRVPPICCFEEHHFAASSCEKETTNSGGKSVAQLASNLVGAIKKKERNGKETKSFAQFKTTNWSVLKVWFFGFIYWALHFIYLLIFCLSPPKLFPVLGTSHLSARLSSGCRSSQRAKNG